MSLFLHAALLAWPLLLVDHVRAPPAALACIALLLLLSIVEARTNVRSSYGSRRDDVLALASSLSLLLIAWLSIGASVDGHWIGAPIALSGILIRGMAIRQLGSGFSSAIEPPTTGRLVSNGIYAWSRHPSEVGLLLISGGIALLGGSTLAAYVIAIVMIPSIVIRVMLEERALSARFGDIHRSYRTQVRIVLPRR